MASARIKKKMAKRSLQKRAINELKAIKDLKLKNSQIDTEVEKAKRQIKKRKQHLSDIRAEFEKIAELKERNLLNTFNEKISLSDLATYAKKAENSGEQYNSAEHWAAIKRYNELVDIGVIPKGSIHDKYDAVEFLQSVLSPEQLSRLNTAAEEKAAILRRRQVESPYRAITFDW